MTDSPFQSRSGDFATSRKGGITADERAFAWEKRCKGAPATAIAQMLQRPVADIEALFAGQDPPERQTYSPPSPSKPSSPLSRLPVAVRETIQQVASHYQLSALEILGESKTKRVSHARQAAYWAVYELRNAEGKRRFSLPQVARLLGRKDHTSALHGVREHEKRLAAAEQEAA